MERKTLETNKNWSEWMREKCPIEYSPAHRCTKNHFTIVMSYMLLLSSTLELVSSNMNIKTKTSSHKIFIWTFSTSFFDFLTPFIRTCHEGVPETHIPNICIQTCNKNFQRLTFIRIEKKLKCFRWHTINVKWPFSL